MSHSLPNTIDVSTTESEDWNDWVAQSPHATVFHREEFLGALEDHSDARLHRLVARRRGQPIGVFPAFSLSKGPATTVFSPPPGMGIPNLGPVLVGTDSPADRAESAAQLVEGSLRWLRDEVDPSFLHLRTANGFTPLHSFDRSDGFDLTPQFTYVVDLGPDRDELLKSFSSDARSNIRDADDRVAVRETRGEDARETIRQIVAGLEERYAEQGMTYPVTADFAVALFDRLPDGWVRPYEVQLDGEYAGGMIALDDGDTVYRWQGGAKPDVRAPVNERLDWRIMEDAIERGRSRYDLVGANTPGLCEYKAKFNPSLVSYYSVEHASRGMGLVADLYQRFRDFSHQLKA